MRIIAMRPEPPGGPVVARFDVDLNNDIRLFNFVLKRCGDGQLRAYPPQLRGQGAAALSPRLAADLRASAITAFNEYTGGQSPHAYQHHAAA